MKQRIIYLLTYFVVFSVITTSCSDFLIQESRTAMTEEDVFAKIDNVEPLVVGLYNSFIEVKKGRGSLIFNFGTDEVKGGERQLIENLEFLNLDSYSGLTPSNERLAEQWSSRWPVVTAAAKAIYALGMTEEEPERARQLMGEASFIRGIFMMELALFWGEIPIIDIARGNELGYGRQSLTEVWEYIINDLEIAAKNMPDRQDDKKRATSYAGYTMLGKAYMAAPVETGFRDFGKAKECFEKVIPHYTLVPRVSILWDVDQPNNSESIFEFQFRKGWPDCNHWMNDLGSGAAANQWGMGCYFAGWDMQVPTQYAYADVAEGGIWEDGDERKYESIRYDFTYNGEPTPPYPTGEGDELGPHIKKWEDIRTDGPDGNAWESGKHFAFLRLADVILCYAECLNEQGQTAEAVNQVNIVRERAWGGNLPTDKKWGAMSQDEFRAQILDERMRELCFEGWRRQDLIRTGNFINLVKERNLTVKRIGAIQNYHTLYPIPDVEIKGNDDITEADQNPGYTDK